MNIKNSMPCKISIDGCMLDNIHYTVGRYKNPKEGSRHKPGDIRGITGCIMFGIDVRPVGGVNEEEIEKIKNVVIGADWIQYYSIGGEGSTANQSRHMHVRIVTTSMSTVKKMKDIFMPLLQSDRHYFTTSDKGVETCISMKISACPVREIATKTPLMHCAYPCKFAPAIGMSRDDITPEDYNNGVTHWTNLFDGEKDCAADTVDWWKQKRFTFHHELHLQQVKQIEKFIAPRNITSGRQVAMANAYAEEHAMEYSKEGHASILAMMLTDTSGDVQYTLAWSDLGIKKKVWRCLDLNKLDDDYKVQLEDVLKVHFASLRNPDSKTVARRVNDARIKALEQEKVIFAKQLKEQKQAIHTMQNEMEKKDNKIERINASGRKSIKEVEVLENSLAACKNDLYMSIKESLDYNPFANFKRFPVYKTDAYEVQNHKRYENKMLVLKVKEEEIKKWRDKVEVKKQEQKQTPPPKHTPPTVSDTPPAKRQKTENKTVEHTCSNCDDLGPLARHNCAVDKGLDPFVKK